MVLKYSSEDEAMGQDDREAVDEVDEQKATVTDKEVDVPFEGVICRDVCVRQGGEIEERVMRTGFVIAFDGIIEVIHIVFTSYSCSVGHGRGR